MYRQVVFNVSKAFSTYIETESHKILIDLGSSDEFNPVLDFLLPLFKARRSVKRSDGRYEIDQCIISHPHKDHISAISDFDKYFFANLLTTPNDNRGMKPDEVINWDLIGNENDESIKTLRKMLEGRQPPLRSSVLGSLFINYIPAKTVEDDEALKNESYPNNISITTYIRYGGLKVLMPGDVQKLAMKQLLRISSSFRNKVEDGVDVLIAPHHGLRSSFSTELFGHMPNGKVRCLNIVPEKINNPDDPREVDARYSTDEFCDGMNSLSSKDEKHYQVRTSRGHVYFDNSNSTRLNVNVSKDIGAVISEFLK